MNTLPQPDSPAKTELREQLAAIEHERWSDWQKWCHKIIRQNDPNLQTENVLMRWDSQIETPYAELSNKEKASDMEQVDRYWPLLEAYIQSNLQAVFDAVRSEVIGEDKVNPIDTYLGIGDKMYTKKQVQALLDTENAVRAAERQQLAAVAKRFGVEG